MNKSRGTNSQSNSTNTDPVLKAWEDVVLHDREPSVMVRPEILNSWRNCKKIGLDPFAPSPNILLSGKKLARLQKQHQDIIEISKPVMNMINISVKGSGFIITLANRDGYVLETIGDKEIMKLAASNFYVPGCLRSSKAVGTNGISLCIEEEISIQISGAEHYHQWAHSWTCSSAPIHNSEMSLVGAITLSGLSGTEHQHTLALISAAADTIGSQIRERRLIEDKDRLNSMLTSIYNSVSDGYIAIDNAQTITHLNKTAEKMLGLLSKSVVGKRFSDIIKVDNFFSNAIETNAYFDGKEMQFKTPVGLRSYLCRMNQIQTSTSKKLGSIISLSERQQMINIAKKLGGNYAKYDFNDIKGKDYELQRQIELAKMASKACQRLLIIGESGTGKELFAHALHNHSYRRGNPFVAISCTAIPRDLIESELFGYRGGAFTGARRDGMVGKFELADKGTLFLDEINGLPIEVQAKLLRVLQQKEIMRLGDNQTKPVDVWVIAASNTDLLDEVEHGNFREDLYYRLNIVELFIPPLRKRLEDIKLLSAHFMNRLCKEMNIKKPDIDEDVFKLLSDYDWPGNVRELENCIARALMLSKGDKIEKNHLPIRQRSRAYRPAVNGISISLQEGQRDIIQMALLECNGNISQAAKSLNIARSTLYRKMQEYGLRTQF